MTTNIYLAFIVGQALNQVLYNHSHLIFRKPNTIVIVTPFLQIKKQTHSARLRL